MKNKKGELSVLVLGLCLLGLSLPAQADTLEAYGDSITAGFMTDTNVTHAPPLKEMSAIISDLAMFLMTKNPAYVAKRHAPDLAWPAVLAKRWGGAKPLPLQNLAVSGARAWQMVDQVKSHKAQEEPSRAFFFIGHNDLCNNMDTPQAIAADFSSEVENSLREWDRQHKNSTAYLVPVADIHRVYKALKGYVWHRGKQANYACEDSWTKFFPYCPSHLKKEQAGTLESYMKPRIEAMNDSLDKLAFSWSKSSSSNKFVYLKDAHNIAYEEEYFAVDCFHLSEVGQTAVADRIEALVAKAP